MIKRKIFVKEIIDFLGNHILSTAGELEKVYIDNLSDAEHTNETTLDWVIAKRNDKQDIVEKSAAKVILVDKEIVYTESMDAQGKILLYVDSPKLCLAKIGNHFFVKRPLPGIHSTAVVDTNAKIGRGVYIGPYCVIGKCVIGDGTIIDSHVRIYDNVVLGKNCNIKTSAVIGGEGFGFEKDENGNRFRFPQLGDVIIGDNVEIGSHSCIDRGALSSTIIGDNTKINNLCHIAHNNKIGKNVVIAAEVNISGGNIIDDDCWIAPSSSIIGYLHIEKEATVGMGAVVLNNIPAGEVWVGNPAKKLR
jgi:UDP-3-O-[3-hydroxymyristoyl] glucosamine N-acyltransferase